MFAMVAFLLFSTAKAYNDRDVCAGGPKHWNVLPPEWRCEPPPFVTP